MGKLNCHEYRSVTRGRTVRPTERLDALRAPQDGSMDHIMEILYSKRESNQSDEDFLIEVGIQLWNARRNTESISKSA